jgi:endonuclease/exonuclease/phosphatase family metal-dependent hydrolase
MKKISLLSFNIGKSGTLRASKKKVDLKTILYGIAKFSQDTQSDILLFQEVDKQASRSNELDVPLKMSQYLNDIEPSNKWVSTYVKAIKIRGEKGGQYGNAIVTKLPYYKKQKWSLGKAENTESEKRAAIALKLQTKDKKMNFWVVNVHLGSWEANQRVQITELGRRLNTLDAEFPVILCGDFNVTREKTNKKTTWMTYSKLFDLLNKSLSSDKSQRKRKEFTDLGPDDGITFPQEGTKIDYCFFSPACNKNRQFKTISATIIDESAQIKAKDLTDHAAIKVTMTY